MYSGGINKTVMRRDIQGLCYGLGEDTLSEMTRASLWSKKIALIKVYPHRPADRPSQNC